MGSQLDLDDVAATSDLAMQELAEMRAEMERLYYENESLRVALKDAASYTRHSAYDWDMGFIKEVDRLLATRLRGGSDE